VNPTLDLVVVKHYTPIVDGNIVGGSGVNPPNFASRSFNGDVGGGIDGSDEVLKVSHNVLP